MIFNPCKGTVLIFSAFRKRTILSSQWVSGVPLAQWIARWTSNPKVLGSTPRWDDGFFLFPCFSWLLCDMAVAEAQFPSASFLSVAVITCASHAQGRRFEPGRKHQYFPKFCNICQIYVSYTWRTNVKEVGSYGVMVSTLDFESSDPSSNLGRTSHNLTPWRNGSASDSRSEGCVFESRRGQNLFLTGSRRHFCPKSMPPMRIELMTFGLQDQRSATEL